MSNYKTFRKILLEDPKLVSALVAWLAGYTRYDIVKMFNIDLDLLKNYNILVDEFGEYVVLNHEKYRRYEKETIERLVYSSSLDPPEILLILLEKISNDELRTLAYVSDFIRRYGKFSLYGISDYIRCVEKPENVNIEFKVLTILQKYLIYMCDRAHRCEEYSWTREFIEIIHNLTRDRFRLPSDGDMLRELSKFVSENVNGLEILAAMYSMCTGTIDQFQSFHKCRVQDVLRGINEINYVYYNGFVNPLSLDFIVKVVRTNIIENIVKKLEHVFNSDSTLVNSEENIHYMDYIINGITIRVPKMYYLSPVFWAKPGAINVLYYVPKDVRAYIDMYKPYFEKGFLVVSQGSNILKIFAFPGHSKNIKTILEKICDVVDVQWSLY